jgi:hypothetical protein
MIFILHSVIMSIHAFNSMVENRKTYGYNNCQIQHDNINTGILSYKPTLFTSTNKLRKSCCITGWWKKAPTTTNTWQVSVGIISIKQRLVVLPNQNIAYIARKHSHLCNGFVACLERYMGSPKITNIWITFKSLNSLTITNL